MVFSQAESPLWPPGSAAIPSISPPAHRLAAFLHKPSTGSCTERYRADAQATPARLCLRALVIARRPEAAGVQDAPIVRGDRPDGVPRGPRLPEGGRAPACCGVTWASGCLPAAVAVRSSLVPPPQGAGRTMFSSGHPSSHLPGGFETAHRGPERCQQGSLASGRPRSSDPGLYGRVR